MFRKKYILGVVLAIFVVCAFVSVVDAVSAAKYKVIDKGTVHPDKNSKVVWKTYSDGKNIVIYLKGYNNFGKKKYKLYSNLKIYLTKVSKSKLKTTTYWYRTKYMSYYKQTSYDETKLSAKSYYLKYYKSDFKNPKG